VTIACERAGDSRLRILVSDNGRGIPAERLGAVFAPFDRLGAEDSAIEGTGLGLALSHRLVGLMGGELTVESEFGSGSTFCVELDLAGSTEERAAEKGRGGDIAANGRETAARLLYIEDNVSNVKLIEQILTHRPQITVQPAMQGRLGIELARQHQPDAILLDLHLPDMSGEQVLDRLKSDPRTDRIPVIVLTADATPGQRRRLSEAGAGGYLTKPLDVAGFLAAIDNVLAPELSTETS
jgi:CheY-like chemotaxis protein